ncbi:MAG: universal stress protein [Dehalococcoidia bacterium]|nr:universal stress protein [Dehalococcoidia bacterium]
MYQKIVVPLDGSKLAEEILPIVFQLASGLEARVHLVGIVDEEVVAPKAGAPTVDVARDAMNKADRYLRSIAPYLHLPPERVHVMATVDRVAAGILKEAEREPDTLIAMSTHGRSGVGRFAIGSVADKVLRATRIPLLLYRPKGGTQVAAPPSTVIVPLDGSALAQKALAPARDIAKKLNLRVLLMRARRSVPVYGGSLGVDWYDPMLDREEERLANDYLQFQERQLEKAGLEVSIRVLEGPAAEAIIGIVRDTPNSLVVMTTRGRSGAARALLGSVADRVVRHANAPVLLIRA